MTVFAEEEPAITAEEEPALNAEEEPAPTVGGRNRQT